MKGDISNVFDFEQRCLLTNSADELFLKHKASTTICSKTVCHVTALILFHYIYTISIHIYIYIYIYLYTCYLFILFIYLFII